MYKQIQDSGAYRFMIDLVFWFFTVYVPVLLICLGIAGLICLGIAGIVKLLGGEP